MHVEEKEEKKNVLKLVENHFETISVIFSLRSKFRSPEVKQERKVQFFSDTGHVCRKKTIISETKIAKTNPKKHRKENEISHC